MKGSQYFLQYLDRFADYVLNFFVAYLGFWSVTIIFGDFVSGSRAIAAVSLISLAVSFLYNYHNVYRPMRTQKMRYFVMRIVIVNTEALAFTILFCLMFGNDMRNQLISWAVISFAISCLVIVSKKLSMMAILFGMRSNRKNLKHILLVTDSQEMADEYMEEILGNPHFGYSVMGYIGNLNVIGLPHLGTTGDLDRVIKEYQPDEVVIAFDTVRKKLITRYINTCNDNCVKVLVVPAICGYFKSPRQVTVVGNLPIIDIRSNPLENFQNKVSKRLLDIIGSAVLIVVTSPLMIFTAIGVKISSPGPILFRQTRVGKNGKEFTMYKFRSMRVNDEQKTGWTTGEDPRKTKFGNFIRRFALDELPQFFNVLKGDMSLVGPRPEVPFFVDKFKKEVPLYMLKHASRPGITGLAQIKGLRGDTSIQARIDEDINYIENWSFWGDIKILLLTPFHTINRQEKYAERDALEQKKMEERRDCAQAEDLTDGKE